MPAAPLCGYSPSQLFFFFNTNMLGPLFVSPLPFTPFFQFLFPPKSFGSSLVGHTDRQSSPFRGLHTLLCAPLALGACRFWRSIPCSAFFIGFTKAISVWTSRDLDRCSYLFHRLGKTFGRPETLFWSSGAVETDIFAHLASRSLWVWAGREREYIGFDHSRNQKQSFWTLQGPET